MSGWRVSSHLPLPKSCRRPVIKPQGCGPSALALSSPPLLPRAPGTNSLALDFPTSTFTCVLSPLPQTLQEGCTKTRTNPHHSCLKPAVIPATAFKKSRPGPAPAASCYSEGSHFDGSLRLLGDASAVCHLMFKWERQRGGLQKHPQHTHLKHIGFYLFH